MTAIPWSDDCNTMVNVINHFVISTIVLFIPDSQLCIFISFMAQRLVNDKKKEVFRNVHIDLQTSGMARFNFGSRTKNPRTNPPPPQSKIFVFHFLKIFMVSQRHNLLIVQWLTVQPLVGWWFLKKPFGLA